MRISQALATKAANLLTAKTKLAIESLSAQVETMALDAYMKSLPKGLIAFDKANPGWVTKEDDLRVYYNSGGIVQTYYASAGISVPVKEGYAKLKANKALNAKIIRMEELREKYRTLKREAYTAVLTLGTSKQVLKAFPETAELFGSTSACAPSTVNPSIIDLKAKLQKQ